MTEMTLTADVDTELPAALHRAQEAMSLPDVQDMVRALSSYGLGVFMPHMHDQDSGSFQVLPSGITSVEDDLQVSFAPSADLKNEGTRTYVPVGWVWSEEAGMECAMSCVQEGTMHKS